MTTKKKAGTVTIAPEAKAPRLKNDGTPWAPAVRRSNSEILAEYKAKREKFAADSAKTLAKYDARIAKFSAAGVSGEDAAKELLEEGMTLAEMAALETKLRKARKALAKKSAEEIEAMKAAVPSFLVVEDADDESDDEE